MEPIFKTSFVWEKIALFPSFLSYTTGFFKKETSIPLSQITSINAGMPTVGRIIVETAGGKKITMLMKPSAKQDLIAAIYKAKDANK